MRKSIVMGIVGVAAVTAGNNNIIIGDDNDIKGSGNVQVGFNAIIDGTDNWTVGNKHVVIGNGVKMFGPAADPLFKNAPTPQHKPVEGVANFVAFFDSFDPFSFQAEGTKQNSNGNKRWYGSSSNWRW